MIKENELFDMNSFMSRYGELHLEELQSCRNHILTKIWEYQNSHQMPTDRDMFADFQDRKIELALLGKMIRMKYDEEFLNAQTVDCYVQKKKRFVASAVAGYNVFS